MSQLFNRKLLGDSAILMALQGAQLLLPVALIPFIIKSFGMELFGLLSFATALCMLFNVIVDYGFNLTATREVSLNSSNLPKISEIFSSVLAVKLVLVFACFCGLALFILISDGYQQHQYVFYLTFGMVIGNALFPIWLFQGMQRFRLVSFINILSKVICTALTFYFVAQTDQFYYIPLLLSLGYIIPALITFFLAKRIIGVSLVIPSIENSVERLRSGLHIFVSKLAVYSYMSMNIIFLEFFTTSVVVGYYTVAAKVVNAISSILSMLNQVLFPSLARVWRQSDSVYYAKLKFLTLLLLLVSALASFTVYLGSNLIVNLLSDEYVAESVRLLEIISIALALIPLGGLLTQSFVTQDRNSLITRVTLASTLFNFALVFTLVPLYGAFGLALAVVLVQVLQVLLNGRYILKLKRETSCAA